MPTRNNRLRHPIGPFDGSALHRFLLRRRERKRIKQKVKRLLHKKR